MIDYLRMEKLEQEARALQSVLIRLGGSRYVEGEGSPVPEAFIIGEAPGAEEDVAGRPFVGAAGKVLRQLMAMAGLFATPSGGVHIENSWLTNVVKFRPPKNAKPTDEEIKAFRPVLLEEWVVVGKPRLIIPVGGVALQAITGKKMSILSTAGKCHKYRARNGMELAIWPMVHPSYGMRSGNEQLQELLEQDWINLGNWRNEQST